MRDVTVGKEDLLVKIKDNLKRHRDMFLEAQTGYRKQVIEELDRMIKDAREGRDIRRHIRLPEPVDHTEDYKTVVAMLEMSTEETIIIEEHEFNSYVLDKWDWSKQTFATNSIYTATAMGR